MAVIISIINNKGGVLKTTTTLTLGAYFASKGFRVLLLDFDAQNSLTEKIKAMSEGVGEIEYDILSLLSGSLQHAQFYTDSTGRLFTLQGNPGINEYFGKNIKDSPNEYNARRMQFKEKAELLRKNFDIILIDCAPGMFDERLLTPNEAALLASDYVLVPVGTSTETLTGVLKVSETVKRLRATNPKLQLLGVFLTLVSVQETIYTTFRELLLTRLKNVFIDAPIRRSAEMQKSLAEKQLIFDYAPKSIAAEDYAALGEQIIKRLNLKP